MAPVMTSLQRRKYAFDRKLSNDNLIKEEQLRSLNKVIIHNAMKLDEVFFSLSKKEILKYYPIKSTEPHLWDKKEGTLHVINSRGVTRKVRDLDLANEIGTQLGRQLAIEVHNYQGDEAKANRRFEEFSFELVTGLFNKLDKKRLESQKSLIVLLGPHSSLENQKILLEKKNEYLDYKIIEIGSKVAVFFDYIFADQAKNILGQIYSTLSAYFRKMDVHIFHFGKVGILNPKLGIGDICTPIAALDESKILNGDKRAYPIHNMLVNDKKVNSVFAKNAGKFHQGTTINMTSVLNQTVETLKKSLDAGGDFLEMEWSVMASMDHGYHSNYPNLGKMHYYLAGVASDKPLEGKTLADCNYPAGRMNSIADGFAEIIKSI